MLKIKRVENEELSHKTKRALIDIICQNGADGKPFKLPNEDELSQRLGVSRNVLRDALMSLEEVGIVTRRRSKGTIANPQIARQNTRLDINPELYQMMVQSNYKVRVETLRLGFVFERDEALGGAQDSYLNVEKVFYGDDVPVAYVADHISGSYAKPSGDSILALKSISHYEFLDTYCSTTMAYTMAHMDAVLPAPWLVEAMKLEPGQPVMKMDDYAYNFDHEVVVHSEIYFRSGSLDLKFLRKNW